MKALEFEVAVRAVDAARARAIEVGAPDLAVIPCRLTDCNRATIETALGAPNVGVMGFEPYATPEAKAGVMLYTLAKSQACIDGNKRIAVVLIQTYLAINGLTITADQDEFAGVVEMVAESNRTDRGRVLEELTSWIGMRLTAYSTEG